MKDRLLVCATSGNKIDPPEAVTAVMGPVSAMGLVVNCLSPFWGLVTAGRLETIYGLIGLG